MEADNEHYQSHWEFFKSVNPKADEIFFVELQINNLDKRIKKGLKEIDFANDRTDTIESNLNDTKRQNFFFNKEYKEFLKAKLKELKAFTTLTPQQSEKQKPEPKETELSESIKKHFGFLNKNCPRKHKQILNDADFDKLIKWTISYFENGFEVPEILEPIKVVNTNKTFVQLAFKYLFKELHTNSPYPKTLFEFYQSAFTPYSKDKRNNFEAVANNDEVKKLMKIHY